MHALYESGQRAKGWDELLERLRTPSRRWDDGGRPPRLPEPEREPEHERPEILWDEV